MRKVLLTALLAGLTLAVLVGAQSLTAGHGKSMLDADTLNGWQEVAGTAGLKSNGSGEFKAKLDDDNQTVEWELTYTGLVSPATVAHIHFGNRYLSGGVSVFFCGGGPAGHVQPACPPGTTTVASLSGTWTPADINGPGGQGIPAASAGNPALSWERFVAALRAGMMYANIHNATFPQGEIRAQINNKDQKQPDEP
jgi:CHRD domain